MEYIKQEFLKDLCIVLITLICSMAGFWLIFGNKYLTADEAYTIIDSKNAVILEKIVNMNDKNKELSRVLENNNIALNNMGLQLQRLDSTLQNIQKNIENR